MSQYFAPLRGLRFYFFDFICDSKSDEIVARTYSSTCFLEGLIYIANYASIVDFSARYTGSRVTYHRVLTSALDFPGLTLCHQRPPNTTSGFLAVLPLPGFGPHVLIRHSRSLRCLGETFPFKSILTRGGLE